MKNIIIAALFAASTLVHASSVSIGGGGGGLDIATGDGEWLRLDTTNDPLTGSLEISGANNFTLNTGLIDMLGVSATEKVSIKTTPNSGTSDLFVTHTTGGVESDVIKFSNTTGTPRLDTYGFVVANAVARDGATVSILDENLGTAAATSVVSIIRSGGVGGNTAAYSRYSLTDPAIAANMDDVSIGHHADMPGWLIVGGINTLTSRTADVIRFGGATRDVVIPNGGLNIESQYLTSGNALLIDTHDIKVSDGGIDIDGTLPDGITSVDAVGDIRTTAGNISVSAGSITASGAITSSGGAISGTSGSFGTGSITGGSTILNSGSTDTNLQVRKTTGADGNALIIAENQDNGTADDAVLIAKTSGNDARLELELAVPAVKFTINLDNDDSDKAEFTYNSNEWLNVTTAGAPTFPLGITSGAAITATSGNIVASTGDVISTTGDIKASDGRIEAINAAAFARVQSVYTGVGNLGAFLTVANQSAGGANTDASVELSTEAAGGDPRIQMQVTGGSVLEIQLDNDASDEFQITHGGNEAIAISTSGGLSFHGEAPVAQGSAIADASGGATVDAEARTAINSLLAYLRLRGDINSPLVNAQSLSPDGTDEYATVPDDAAFTSNAFSVCMWMKGASQTNAVVAQWDTGTSNRSWNIGTSGANLQCLVDQDGTFTVNSKNYTGSQTVMDSSWHHACCTFDAVANNMSLYVDGVLDGAPTKTVDDNLASVHNAATTVIHAAQNGGATNHWTGLMDEVAFFDTQLTGSQVSEIYSAAGAVDISATTAAGNLVAWWRYEDALVTSLADSSGNGHTAVGTNMEAADLDADTPP